MGFGGTSGGSSSIAMATDVALSSPTDAQVLTYDGTTAKWKNATSSASGTITADQVIETASNKVMTAAERTKLGGIATGATANSSDATLLNRANHTGTQTIATVTTLQTELDTREVVVRWNASTSTWAARPSAAAFGAIFLSTNDPAATTPTDVNKQVGDVWRRHPDAS